MLKKIGEPFLSNFKALSTDDWNILSKHSNMETINLISSTETLTPDQLLEWLEAQKNNFNISFQKLEPRIGEYYEGSFSINLVKLDDNSGKEFLKELNDFFSPFFTHRYQLKNLEIYYSYSGDHLILYNYEHYFQIILL